MNPKEEHDNSIFREIWEHKFSFFSIFFLTLLISYGFLFAVDFIPEKPDEEKGETGTEEVTGSISVETAGQADIPVYIDPEPIRIIIDSLDKDIRILNPESRSIADLDEALLSGVVRHPDSADLDDEGNMFLFGHSSYLPTVFNKNFQAFNGIQDLVWGDVIRVQSGDREYVYRVKRVYKTLASEASVTLDNSSPKLTLATCNSFGTKDDRFVVEADLIESYPL